MYKKIERLLNEKGITFYRLSKEIGISPVVFSELKKGKSKPKLDKLQKIADYFDVPITYFLDEQGVRRLEE